MRTLRRGSRGIDVEFMQRLLVRADVREHADAPYFGSSGRFDEECDRAIRLFQDKAGWTPHYTNTGVDQQFQPLCFGPAYFPPPIVGV